MSTNFLYFFWIISSSLEILLSTVKRLIVLLWTFKPLTRYFLQFSIIEFKIEGTPGKLKTFLVIKPGAALAGL